jgi:hypothetical protein
MLIAVTKKCCCNMAALQVISPRITALGLPGHLSFVIRRTITSTTRAQRCRCLQPQIRPLLIQYDISDWLAFYKYDESKVGKE